MIAVLIVTASLRLMISLPSLVMAPVFSGPMPPPSPTFSVPALMVVLPLLGELLLAVSTRVPGPAWTRDTALVTLPEKVTISVLAPCMKVTVPLGPDVARAPVVTVYEPLRL
ncbi:hypothetical protein MCEMAEM4_03364 [Burkholderiaceae bacterium]